MLARLCPVVGCGCCCALDERARVVECWRGHRTAFVDVFGTDAPTASMLRAWGGHG